MAAVDKVPASAGIFVIMGHAERPPHDFELTEDEPSIAHIAKIESLADPNIPLFAQWADVRAKVPHISFFEAQKEMIFKNPGEKKFEKLNEFQTAKIDMEMGPLPETKKGIIGILKALQHASDSWETALPAIVETEKDVIAKAAMQLNVIEGVGGIVSKYKVVDGELRKVSTFIPANDDPRPIFLWNVATTRIFFKFMEHGGQKHYAFCERCGNFTLVFRKGRKRFCSDLCRVLEHQVKEGTYAKILHPIKSAKK